MDEEILANWLVGKKRRSRHSNAFFATRKERQLFDRQFLNIREKKRSINPATDKLTRRAKSVREI